jgi:hypothetical protein
MEDPFMFVQKEVEEDLQGIVVLFENWKLQRQEKVVSEVEFKCATQELRTRINEIEYDVQDLRETIDVVQKDRVRYKISKKEIARREQFIADATRMTSSLKDELQKSQEVKPSVSVGFQPRPSSWPMNFRKAPPPSVVIDLVVEPPSPPSLLVELVPTTTTTTPLLENLLSSNNRAEEEFILNPNLTSNPIENFHTTTKSETETPSPSFLSPRQSSSITPLMTPRKAQLVAYLNSFGVTQPVDDKGSISDGSESCSEFLEEISVDTDLEEQALRLKKSYGYNLNSNLILGRKSCFAMILLFAAVAMLLYSFVI